MKMTPSGPKRLNLAVQEQQIIREAFWEGREKVADPVILLLGLDTPEVLAWFNQNYANRHTVNKEFKTAALCMSASEIKKLKFDDRSVDIDVLPQRSNEIRVMVWAYGGVTILPVPELNIVNDGQNRRQTK